jgi:hypothetical protein
MRQTLAQVRKDALLDDERRIVNNLVLLKDDAVINAVKALRLAHEISPRRAALAQTFNDYFRLDQLVFQKTHEHKAIKRALRRFR